MKTLIITLLFLDLTVCSYSQEKVKKEEIMKVANLPAVVIKSVGDDFSVYLPDNNPDKDVRRLEEPFTAFDIGKAYEDAESNLLIRKLRTILI
ncbi:hypothetical protein [Flavobacterium sp. ACAM 123]|jgi:hypothetical protein|uniref:hypothetical protein n=1 Tax=Flavobacterium sp. ACAM 123 TaxID=1189620 RepID=UPI0003176B77|nr:hypothetical protein [Flavobacterium sp. ACAM 123]